MSAVAIVKPDIPGFTPSTLEVERDLADRSKVIATRTMGDCVVDVRPGRDTLWVIVRRPGKGGIALRTVRNVGPLKVTGRASKAGGAWRVETLVGEFVVKLTVLGDALMRVTTSLTPSADLLVPFWPRDLYPLDANDRPTSAKGWVEAAQRGFNTGLCYFCVDKPAFGSVLYVQNLTALNPYFEATGTKPDGVVGGEWPELGYQPPTAPIGNSPPVKPLPAGKQVAISDAFIAFRKLCGTGEQESASQFIDMLADVYPHIDKPQAEFHDWIGRAEKTLRDLDKSPEAIIQHYGHKYLHPYVETEYPDSMVQMTVVASIREFEHARDKPIELADELFAGVPRFFDKDLESVRRYLPNVGEDKNANAVDSWYLYHPLMNLARLAARGDKKARELLLGGVDFGIKAARHFKYVWPIQFDVRDFSIITASRNAQGLGQTDVGGLYAYLMLQAHELTEDGRFLDEAKRALKALEESRFELVYQTNLSAWGATACMRLWRLEQNPRYLKQSLTFVAGFLHNCELWDSQIANARTYTNFFGVTCLHDAPYMAAYECFESFAAFDEYLGLCDDTTPASVRMLLAEYRRYTLDRAWYFYPDALPPDGVAKENIRNGRIDKTLSFPLEDVYGDGQPAGQVGQEIYGSGGAFVFAARAFFECGDAPLRLFADYPALVEQFDNALTIRLHGPPGLIGTVRVLRKGKRALPRVAAARLDTEDTLPAQRRGEDFREYRIPADGAIQLTWAVAGNRRNRKAGNAGG